MLFRSGLAARQHVGSSQTRDRTRVPCIGRRILNHCATREVRMSSFLIRELYRNVVIQFPYIGEFSRDVSDIRELYRSVVIQFPYIGEFSRDVSDIDF